MLMLFRTNFELQGSKITSITQYEYPTFLIVLYRMMDILNDKEPYIEINRTYLIEEIPDGEFSRFYCGRKSFIIYFFWAFDLSQIYSFLQLSYTHPFSKREKNPSKEKCNQSQRYLNLGNSI